MPESYQQLEKRCNALAGIVARSKMRKPYPKRIQTGEKIFAIIMQQIRAEVHHRGASDYTKEGAKRIAGTSTEYILKLIQNNYRRRRKKLKKSLE